MDEVRYVLAVSVRTDEDDGDVECWLGDDGLLGGHGLAVLRLGGAPEELCVEV